MRLLLENVRLDAVVEAAHLHVHLVQNVPHSHRLSLSNGLSRCLDEYSLRRDVCYPLPHLHLSVNLVAVELMGMDDQDELAAESSNLNYGFAHCLLPVVHHLHLLRRTHDHPLDSGIVDNQVGKHSKFGVELRVLDRIRGGI